MPISGLFKFRLFQVKNVQIRAFSPNLVCILSFSKCLELGICQEQGTPRLDDVGSHQSMQFGAVSVAAASSTATEAVEDSKGFTIL
jgi:hypothetical protein